MLNKLKVAFMLALLLFSIAGYADGAPESGLSCPNDFINPVSDVNWNNALPIIIGGIESSAIAGKAPRQPRDLKIKAICETCKLFPPFGLGITYWQPDYIAAVQNKDGCITSLAGSDIVLLDMKSLVSH